MVRILLYNWVQYDDIERRGGGVRIYEKNLISHLINYSDHDITVVSSGLQYDVLDPTTRFERTENQHGGQLRSFALVNSPVLAPGHHAFGNPHLFDEGPTLQAWHRFLLEEGPFDVVQFDSLEGIPFTFLRVHEALPEAQVLLYAHNYYMVCPQVNLWKWESEACSDFNGGRDCVNCVPHLANPAEVLRAHQIARLLRRAHVTPNTRGYALAYRLYGRLRAQRHNPFVRALAVPARRLLSSRSGVAGKQASGTGPPKAQPKPPSAHNVQPVSLNSPDRATAFVTRRHRALNLINAECDVVVCTSHRVLEVLRAHGVRDECLSVAYVGTRAAEAFESADLRREPRVRGELSLCYLGYMRRDKGFYFLLDTLEACPREVLSKIRLVLGAKSVDGGTMDRLTALSRHMVDIVHYDGYTHDQLPDLLDSVDVGIVPVQWEDNLPQVATEIVAHGIPIITSDRGGAKELGGSNPSFVFNADETEDLVKIWRRLISGDLQPGDYWKRAQTLTTMDDHVQRLMELYKQAASTVDRSRPQASDDNHGIPRRLDAAL